MLGPVFDPSDPRTEAAAQEGDNQLFVIDVGLGPESSADFGDGDPQALLGPTQRLTDRSAHQERDLRRGPQVDSAVPGVVGAEYASALQRAPAVTSEPVSTFDDDAPRGDVASSEPDPGRLVSRSLWMHLPRLRIQRCPGVDHRLFLVDDEVDSL